MSDPQRLKNDKPRRAEPLQPDRPGRGQDASDADRDDPQASRRASDAARERSETALDNVREGYD